MEQFMCQQRVVSQGQFLRRQGACRQPGMRRHQHGMTFIGLLCILVLVGTIGYAGLRLVPLYLNYMKVARSMDAAAADAKGENPDPGTLRNSLERHWEIEDITGVDYKDVEVVKDERGIALHVAYDDSAPYIANVSLAVHFDKTVKVR
jgi:anaerobic selenocysteine-containing dehydrogenase